MFTNGFYLLFHIKDHYSPNLVSNFATRKTSVMTSLRKVLIVQLGHQQAANLTHLLRMCLSNVSKWFKLLIEIMARITANTCVLTNVTKGSLALYATHATVAR